MGSTCCHQPEARVWESAPNAAATLALCMHRPRQNAARCSQAAQPEIAAGNHSPVGHLSTG
eukprot:12920117-Prorocentrum_lima.AAC.1